MMNTTIGSTTKDSPPPFPSLLLTFSMLFDLHSNTFVEKKIIPLFCIIIPFQFYL